MSTIADLFAKEDRTEITFSALYGVLKGVATAEAKAELLMNAVNCEVPHKFIREMATGKKEEPEPEPPKEAVETVLLATEEPAEKEQAANDLREEKPGGDK